MATSGDFLLATNGDFLMAMGIPHHPLIRSCGYAKTPMPFVVLAGASVNTIAELSSIRPTTRSGHSAPATKLTITGA
jgi:hypothetical protein